MFPDIFQTKRLMLRPMATADANAVFRCYAQDPQVTRYLTWRPHQTPGETQAYIAGCLAASAEASRTYLLIGRDDFGLRGAIDLRLPAKHHLAFGYLLARPWWGQGLMAEVLREVVRWGLAQPRIFRAGAVCDIDNVASARVMEKAGLIREGVLRRWLVHPNISDQPRDCFSYARVR